MRYLSEAERKVRLQAWLAQQGIQVVVRESTPQRAVAGAGLSATALDILIKSAREPGVARTAVYRDLRISDGAGATAIKELIAGRYVAEHRMKVHPGKGGGSRFVLEVLPRGIDELARHQLKPAPPLVTRGSWLHDVWAREVGNWARAHDCTDLRYEWTFGEAGEKKTLDVAWLQRSGERVGAEICLSTGAKWAGDSALRAARIPGMAHVLVLTDSKAMKDAIQRRLDQVGLFGGKISVEYLAQYAEEWWSRPGAGEGGEA